MALEVANYGGGGPRTAPGGLRTFYKREAVTPRDTPNQNELLQTDEPNIEIDYELLVTNVENMLIADKARFRRDLAPKDLLIKSNPGLFSNMHADITNPRDMYNFLSKNKFPKVADDSLLFARQTTLYENNLSRSNSFRDLNKSSDKKIKKKYHFHSHQDLSLIQKRDPSFVAMNSNTPYFGPEDMARLPEREKTMMTNFNLPSLNEGGNEVGKNELNEGTNNPLSLPAIKSAPTDMPKGTRDDETKRSKFLGNRAKPNVTFNNKIDKWFSEMPSDVTDKASRAIMQDSMRERLAMIQNGHRFDEKNPKFKHRDTNAKSLNQIQHHYIELRAGTAPKPPKSDVNFSHFKVKQKSSLSSKTDSCIEKKVHGSQDQRLNNVETTNDENNTAPKDITKSRNSCLSGLKKINVDQFAVDAYKSNPNSRFNFAQLQNVNHHKALEEMNEDSLRRKVDREHWLRMNQPKTNPSIVNISLDKKIVENERTNQLQQTLSVIRMDGILEDGNRHVPIHSEFPSNQDDNSRSSSTSGSVKRKKQMTSKTALSKFNMLEVFANGQNPPLNNTIYTSSGKFDNPLIKYDMRQSRSRQRQSKEFRNPVNDVLTRQPHEMSTVDFRFGSGEVIISRKPHGGAVVLPDPEIAAKSPNAPPNNTEYSELSANTIINGYSETHNIEPLPSKSVEQESKLIAETNMSEEENKLLLKTEPTVMGEQNQMEKETNGLDILKPKNDENDNGNH